MTRADGSMVATTGQPVRTQTGRLQVTELTLRFGGLLVLDRVDLEVVPAQIHGLIGPNGAGKTSLFNCISGLYRPDAGRVLLDDVNLLAERPHQLAGRGVARTFQHPTLELSTSVLENVLIGAHAHSRTNLTSRIWLTRRSRVEEKGLRDRAAELLDYVGLAPQAGSLAGGLPYGSQKRVELCRALMAEPTFLMLDEPACGLTHGEVDDLGALIERVRAEFSLSVLLVEHHMGLVSSITDCVTVLVQGRNTVEGTPDEVRAHPLVIEAYLGGTA